MKKIIAASCLALLLASTLSQGGSNIRRARNLVRGSQLYYDQTFPRLSEYLRNIGFGRNATLIEQAAANLKNLEAAVETDLQQKLNPSEKIALATDRRNLELYQILMNAKVPDEINLLFDKLENITRNAAPEIRDYRREMAEILPKTLEINQKIVSLQKQIDSLKKEKEKLLASIKPNLSRYYERMKQSSDFIFDQTKRIGAAIEEKAQTESQQVGLMRKKIDELKKTRVNPTLLAQKEQAKKAKDSLLEQTIKEASRLGDAEVIRLSSIVDLLKQIELTKNTILYGPEEIKQWDLTKDIFKIKTPAQHAAETQK